MANNSDGNATSSYSAELDGNLTSLPAAITSQKLNYYYGLGDDIFFYGLCIVLPFGLLGNLFIVFIFLRSSSLKKTTTGQLLVALAIADSTVLIGEMFRWLSFGRLDKNWKRVPYFPHSLGLNFYETSAAGCKITQFLKYSGKFWSAWITVVIAVERLIAVAWPLKIISISTPRRVQILIALIGFSGLILGLFPFWTVDKRDETDEQGCWVIMTRFVTFEVFRNIVIKCFTLAIPCALITVLTVVIIYLLYRARNRRMACLSGPTKSRCQSTAVKAISVEAQMTIMLVAVCVSTIALRAPYRIVHEITGRFWHTDPDDEIQAITYFANALSYLINIINNAVNFVLYCLCGSSFRKECAQQVRCCRKDDQMISPTSKKVSIKCCGIGESPTKTELELEID